MRIRLARSEDALAIAAMYVDSWRVGYAGRFPAGYLPGLDVGRAGHVWQAVLADPNANTTTLLSEDGGDVTGVVQVGPTREADLDSARWGEVTMLYVSPGSWGKGVGRALLARGVEELDAAGYSAAHLWALAGNERAERLYTGSGWARAGRTKTDDSRGFRIDEVLWTTDIVGGAR